MRTSSSTSNRLTEKTIMASVMARANSSRANLLSDTWRGVPSSPRSTRIFSLVRWIIFATPSFPSELFLACLSRPAILPTSVAMPTAVTIPVARPRVIVLAEYTMLTRSPRGTSWSARTLSACLLMGRDSPVRRASSVERLMLSPRRRSAGMTSPTLSRTMSPTTRPSALMVSIWPSRMTLQVGAERA